MNTTDAIKAAISATAPSKLQWLPNPGHEPVIEPGFEFVGVRLRDGTHATCEACSADEVDWEIFGGKMDVIEYAIRRKSTQPNPTPTLAEVTPVTEDAHELRKCLVLGALNRSWQNLETIATRINEPRELVAETLNQLVGEGRASCFGLGGAWRSDTPIVDVIEPPPISKQSGAMVISGRLTAVGENFAGITSGDKTLTLGINAEQARWFGKYIGGEVKLTVEVVL